MDHLPNQLPSGEHPNTPQVSPPPPSPDVDFTTTTLLRRLHVTILNLPSTVPLENESDSIASFSSDPRLGLEGGRDVWEDVIHPSFDKLLYNRTTINVSQVIRCGPLGMDGFYEWVQTCILHLNISSQLLKRKRVARRVVVDSDNESDCGRCQESDCEDSSNKEMITCAGPACGSRVRQEQPFASPHYS